MITARWHSKQKLGDDNRKLVPLQRLQQRRLQQRRQV